MPVKKATKAPARRAVAAPVPVGDIPEELRDFYGDGPPRLSRPRGAGTTGDGYEPMQLTTPTRAERAEVPTEPLFYIDGVEYGIPKAFPPALALLYLDGVDEGRDVAAARVLKHAIGGPGWAALMTYVKSGGAIGEQAMAAMLELIMVKVMGAMEETWTGN